MFAQRGVAGGTRSWVPMHNMLYPQSWIFGQLLQSCLLWEAGWGFLFFKLRYKLLTVVLVSSVAQSGSVTHIMHVCYVVSDSLWPLDCRPLRFCPWDSPGNTGVGWNFLLQGLFLTQGSKSRWLCLLHCRWILYCWAIREAHWYIFYFRLFPM